MRSIVRPPTRRTPRGGATPQIDAATAAKYKSSFALPLQYLRECVVSVLFDRKNFVPLHLAWMLGTLAAAIGATVWYASYIRAGRPWPGGGSVPGLVLGIVAGLIILFEFALWPRKTPLFRTSRWLGKTQTWMKAHIWLGLLVLPLAWLHAGGSLSFGGTYTSLLMWLLFIVVGSGVVGLVMQNILPRLLIERAPGETIAGQIDEVARQLAEDARTLVIDVCDEVEQEPVAARQGSETSGKQRVGVARHVGTARPVGLDPELTRSPRVNSPQLAAALRQEVDPFLRRGWTATGNFASAAKARLYFDNLRQQSPVSVHSAIERIEALCQRRRELAMQARLQFWLHAWLLVHLPLSILLLVLLAGHVYFALQFG
ncbi:MAG: hypothetical protein IAF94_01065 [Pirellulaceae bacterium]|nr:hypothetical protein [Pirellulaceae bacterium]